MPTYSQHNFTRCFKASFRNSKKHITLIFHQSLSKETISLIMSILLVRMISSSTSDAWLMMWRLGIIHLFVKSREWRGNLPLLKGIRGMMRIRRGLMLGLIRRRSSRVSQNRRRILMEEVKRNLNFDLFLLMIPIFMLEYSRFYVSVDLIL